jgi:hypothetical protein
MVMILLVFLVCVIVGVIVDSILVSRAVAIPESCVVTRTVKTDFLQAEYFQQEETAIDRHVTATCFEPTAMIKCLRSGNNASDAPACVADDHPPEFSLTDQAAVSEPVMGSPP